MRPSKTTLIAITLISACMPLQAQYTDDDESFYEELEQTEAKEKQHQEAEQLKQQQARQAEEQRQAEASKQNLDNQMRQAEEAITRKDYRAAITSLHALLNHAPTESDDAFKLRERLLQVVGKMQHPPKATPDYERHTVRGEAMLSTQGALAAQTEFEAAVASAPWIANSYYNLAQVNEQNQQYAKAMQNLQWYLLANRSLNDAQRKEIRTKIYQLEVKKDAQDIINRLNGKWHTPGNESFWYTVKAGGNSIRIEANNGVVITGTINQNTIEGHMTSPPYQKGTCNIPGGTVKISQGKISSDWKKISFNYIQPQYQTRFSTNFFNPYCISVTPYGEIEQKAELVK